MVIFGRQVNPMQAVKTAVKYSNPVTTVGDIVKDRAESYGVTWGSGAQQPTMAAPAPANDPYNSLYDGSATMVQGASTTGSGSGTGSAADPNLINQIYDSRIGRLQGMLGRIPTQQDQALNAYNTSYDQALGQLNSAKQSGTSNLDFQAGENMKNKQRSYRDIAQGIRNTMESTANRLGTMNAGDSSASQMLAYALANLQAQQRGQANDVFSSNDAQIGMARTNMENEFQNQLNALNNEKRSRIQAIADQYAATRQQILDEIATSDEARAFELANLGQQYTSKVLADIANLENQYNTASQNWVTQAMQNVPQVNTQPFSQTAQTQTYGTYGRGELPVDNLTADQIQNAYDEYGMPLRKYKNEYGF